MAILTRRDFDLARLDDLVAFAKAHSLKPHWPEKLVRRFVERLSSSTKQVIDLFEGERRVLSAVVLDLVENPSHSACLEILGYDSRGRGANDDYAFLINEAKNLLNENKGALQYGAYQDSPIDESFEKKSPTIIPL